MSEPFSLQFSLLITFHAEVSTYSSPVWHKFNKKITNASTKYRKRFNGVSRDKTENGLEFTVYKYIMCTVTLQYSPIKCI